MMAGLDEQLAALATMPPTQLRAEWERLHRSATPDFTPDLLRRGIAYRLQEKVFGPMPAATRRELDRRVRQYRRGGADKASVRIKPGTRLTREWHGRTYHVIVADKSYTYDDESYASLTAIARRITGVAWSGPRFFGLGAKRSEQRG